MDALLGDQLLQGPLSKLQLAADEGVKLKHLVGAVRALWRSSPTGNHPHVTHLKTLLRPSPQRQRILAAADSPAEAREMSDGEDSGLENVSDNDSILSATTLELPGNSPRVSDLGGDDDEDGDDEDDLDGSSSAPASPMSEDSFDPNACSQRPGAWQGEAYVVYNALEKSGRTVVPLQKLLEWVLDGEPSKTEFVNTFFQDDLQCLWLNLFFSCPQCLRKIAPLPNEIGKHHI